MCFAWLIIKVFPLAPSQTDNSGGRQGQQLSTVGFAVKMGDKKTACSAMEKVESGWESLVYNWS